MDRVIAVVPLHVHTSHLHDTTIPGQTFHSKVHWHSTAYLKIFSISTPVQLITYKSSLNHVTQQNM